METRIYENGVLQGAAVKQSSGGEVEERQYVEGKLNGKATVIYTDTSKEMRTYKVTTFPLFCTTVVTEGRSHSASRGQRDLCLRTPIRY